MFDDDSTSFATLPSQNAFQFVQPSSYKVQTVFGLSSSSDDIDIEDKDGDQDDQVQATQGYKNDDRSENDDEDDDKHSEGQLG